MESGWSELLFSVLQAIFVAVLPLLAVAVTRWVLGEVSAQKKRLDVETLRSLEWIADIAVKAAEQVHAAGYIADKKTYAMKMAQEWLNSRNIAINIGIIEGAVEAAVLKEFNSQWSGEGPGESATEIATSLRSSQQLC